MLTGAAARAHAPDQTVCYELAGSAAVFRGDLKLVRSVPPFSDSQWRLFDLAADPGETRDLSAERPADRAALEAAYSEYARRVGVVEPPSDYSPLAQLVRNIPRLRGVATMDH